MNQPDTANNLTSEEKQELTALGAEFVAMGGRGIYIADRIDVLRRKEQGLSNDKLYLVTTRVVELVRAPSAEAAIEAQRLYLQESGVESLDGEAIVSEAAESEGWDGERFHTDRTSSYPEDPELVHDGNCESVQLPGRVFTPCGCKARTPYEPMSSAARQAWIDGVSDDELREIDATELQQ